MQRLIAGGGLEAPHEVADAHAVLPGDVFEAEFVGKMLFEPMLDLQDDHVLVQLLPTKADTPRRVAALHFVENVTGHGLGDVGAAEAFDQVDIQVARRGSATGAIQVVGVGEVLVLVELDLGKALAECIEEAPVGGRLLAIEQSSFRQPEHPGGFATEHGAASVLITQPRQHLGVAGAQGVEVIPEGR